MPTQAQQQLIDRLSTFLVTEEQVEALWLAGSLGRGQGDAYSDIDLLALLAEGMPFPEASARLAERVREDLAPVLLNSLFGGRVLNCVTADWQRFDISLIEGADLARYDGRHLIPLFNRGANRPPERPDQPYRTSPEQLARLVNEFLRVLGLLVVGVGRQEYQLCLSGADLLRRMTFDLMLEENGVGPADRGGALHRNPLLTAEQQGAFAALPVAPATREGAIASHLGFAAIFLPRARRLAETIGAEWPTRFEDATRAHLNRNLGIGW